MIDPRLTEPALSLIEAARAAPHPVPLVVGIAGAQGSGKSTLVAHLAALLETRGVPVATLSLDDLYLSRADRQRLAAEIHPLFATRGVPGTHDVALGLATIAALERVEAAPLPRFDKATDDRVPLDLWPLAPAGTQVLLIEGWCLGAQPQANVSVTVNRLEADEDAQAIWRSHVNMALAGEYQTLFSRIDRLIFLAAPTWDVVARWREQQEAELRKRDGPGVMSPEQVARFVQHYERLTRWLISDLPGRADLTVRLGPDREVLGLEC